MLMALMMSFAFARTAHLGVADVGGGRGVLGHVFLVIANDDADLSDAVAYQFAVEVPDEVRVGPRIFGDLARYPFTLSRVPARALIDSYVDEDRAVVLFRLKIDARDLDRIEVAAEAERAWREASPRRDFRVDHNCATATLDLINAALGPRGFAYASPRKLLGWPDPRAWLSIPIAAAPRLARHPSIDGRRTFEPRSARELRAIVAAFADLTPLFDACGTSPGARALLGRAFANRDLRESEAYLRAFDELLGPCARRTGLVDVYDGHLDFMNYLARDEGTRERIGRAYLD